MEYEYKISNEEIKDIVLQIKTLKSRGGRILGPEPFKTYCLVLHYMF